MSLNGLFSLNNDNLCPHKKNSRRGPKPSSNTKTFKFVDPILPFCLSKNTYFQLFVPPFSWFQLNVRSTRVAGRA